jgi:hypothetical protein
MTPGSTIIAIDMATSAEVEPPGPTGVIVTDLEVLLVAAGSDASVVTRVPADTIVGAVSSETGCISIEIAAPDAGENRVIGLDFRYFGETDNTIAKLLVEFGTASAR